MRAVICQIGETIAMPTLSEDHAAQASPSPGKEALVNVPLAQSALKLDHVTLVVSSLADSMPYYDALLPLLGFAKRREQVWTDGAGFYIQFLQAKSGTRPYERYGPGLNHMGFAAPDPATVVRIRAAMIEAGFAAPELQALGGATALFMKDPDGLRIEITHYPPGVAVVD